MPGDISDLLTIDSIEGVFDGIPGSGDPRQVTDFFHVGFSGVD
jgi:hypothetical protein